MTTADSNPGFGIAQGATPRPADAPFGPVVLEGRNLKKSYSQGPKVLPVLLDANITLHKGEMIAIVAPSGAGKSTLLHLLAALDMPTSGTVYFATKAIESDQHRFLREFRHRGVGFLWQRHQLLVHFTAEENGAKPLVFRGQN